MPRFIDQMIYDHNGGKKYKNKYVRIKNHTTTLSYPLTANDRIKTRGQINYKVFPAIMPFIFTLIYRC